MKWWFWTGIASLLILAFVVMPAMLRDSNGTVVLLTSASKKELLLLVHTPDGDRVADATTDGVVRVYDQHGRVQWALPLRSGWPIRLYVFEGSTEAIGYMQIGATGRTTWQQMTVAPTADGSSAAARPRAK